MRYIKVCSTDGNLLVNLDSIRWAVENPDDKSTSMLVLNGGAENHSFEVSGSIEDIERKIKKEREE
jgi:hypothetical protein